MGRKKGAPAKTPTVKNEYMKELPVFLKGNQSPTGKELSEAIDRVPEMEKQLASVVDELKAMRQGPQGLQEQNHPLGIAPQKSVKALEANVAILRERLAGLKGAAIKGCKNVLAAMKECGIGALDSAAQFSHVKSRLESLRNTINDGVKADEKAIPRVEAVSAEYYETGRHLKNIGRALMRKGATQEAKAVGRLAKMVQVPYWAERICYLATRDSLDEVVSSLERLEEAAEK